MDRFLKIDYASEFKKQVNEAVECLELGKAPPANSNLDACLAAIWKVISRMCKEEKEVGRG